MQNLKKFRISNFETLGLNRNRKIQAFVAKRKISQQYYVPEWRLMGILSVGSTLETRRL